MKNKKTFIFKNKPDKIGLNGKEYVLGHDFTWNPKTRIATLITKEENIFKCTKCKGQKVRTRTHGMICMNCKPPRTGRVEKKGDREKLEKELKRINGLLEKLIK